MSNWLCLSNVKVSYWAYDLRVGENTYVVRSDMIFHTQIKKKQDKIKYI
jgi:hypothetical protein